MSRDSGDFDIDDSSENVLSEWPRAADEPSGGESEGSRGSETWSIAAPAPVEETSSRPIRSSRRGASRSFLILDPETELEPEFPEHRARDRSDRGRAVARTRGRRARDPGGVRRPRRRPGRAAGAPVGIVVARFNGSVTSQLLDRALAELETVGVRRDAITIMVVPGAFELPIAATALAKMRRFACIVALGCVIRGTLRTSTTSQARRRARLPARALETGVPVSFGVLTLERVEQAEPRVEKGAEAVRSALEMAAMSRTCAQRRRD